MSIDDQTYTHLVSYHHHYNRITWPSPLYKHIITNNIIYFSLVFFFFSIQRFLFCWCCCVLLFFVILFLSSSFFSHHLCVFTRFHISLVWKRWVRHMCSCAFFNIIRFHISFFNIIFRLFDTVWCSLNNFPSYMTLTLSAIWFFCSQVVFFSLFYLRLQSGEAFTFKIAIFLSLSFTRHRENDCNIIFYNVMKWNEMKTPCVHVIDYGRCFFVLLLLLHLLLFLLCVFFFLSIFNWIKSISGILPIRR